MPTVDKPLFRPEAIRHHLKTFTPSESSIVARPKLTTWADKLSSGKLDKAKETELLPDYLSDIFGAVLGFTGRPADLYTLRREALVQVDGKFADAALGQFTAHTERFVAALEGKGPLDPLDRPFKSRKLSAVDQGLKYAVQLRVDWYLVTNLKEIRLFHKGHDTHTFERFELAEVAADDAEFRRFVYLLGAERLVATGGPHLNGLLTESASIGQMLTTRFYADYRGLREQLFAELRRHNPQHDPARLLTGTQKILDRVLFVAFCEDRQLLPTDIIRKAFEHRDDFNPRPVWQNFIGLFRSVDKGNDKLNIARYNGGLFADDTFLNELTIPDAVCEGFKKLADYEFGNMAADADSDAPMIDVEILGHIFEQSISDLEELHRKVSVNEPVEPTRTAPTKRKKEGAFYTPAYVTRYIVAETLGPVIREKFEKLRAGREATAAARVRKVYADPRSFDLDKLTGPQIEELVAFWETWLGTLETIRVVDPSCGSGAFLIEAFDQLFLEYSRSQGYLTELKGGRTLFDVQRAILTQNLFGMDLNGEAIEIARLSCWIKTAEQGKELTALDANIQAGNSVVAEPDPVSAWKQRFPDVFADGGFDVVIGNPPYVRQEWISADKPFLQQHYQAFSGTADLYVYFYELGMKLLKPGGRLGFIVTNKWMKAGYGEPLRRYFGESAWLESIVDLGHNKDIFPDADVFPCILVARKPSNSIAPPKNVRACILPRELLRVEDLSRQADELGATVPRSRFHADLWNLEPPGVVSLMAKIKANGVPLREFAGVEPLYGIKTGFNEAFLIDAPMKERLVSADPESEPLFRRSLRGQDLDRWQPEWKGQWMIAMKSSGNHPWPWAGKSADEAEAVFRQTYPALHQHMKQYESELKARKNSVEHWWELSGSNAWDRFDRPKIMYQDITWNQRFGIDTAGTLSNNTVYFLPTADGWVLAVLNAAVSWWFMWRTAQHGKDEALRLFTDYLNHFPIPTPTPEARAEVETHVARLIEWQAHRMAGIRAVLDWLRVEFGIEKPTQKLAALDELSADDLIAEVKKLRGRKLPLSVSDVKRLKDEHTASVQPLRAGVRESLGLERRVSELVNAAYGLTAEDVALMWQTAPPRMPIPRPAEG